MQSVNFKNWCQELRTKGHTLGEISIITSRPKTTVYFHVRNMPLTKKLLEKIKNIRINSIRGRGPKRGKSLLGYRYKKFNRWTPSLVNLVAHMLFDGAIKREGVLYYNRSPVLLENFKSKMAIIYNGKPKVYKSNDGVMRFAYHNVELGDFFITKSSRLLDDITKLPINFKLEFLKAFFDDEGSVDFRGMKRRIKGYQHNDRILYLVHELLGNFKINSFVDSRFHEILVTRKENIERFAKEINFSRGIRVNGKRSNSVWRKSIEKRKILSNLLASYR